MGTESKDELKRRLTPEQYEVTQKNATERAFTGKYWDHFEDGLYVDIVDGTPLFTSRDKFASGCGWPSFAKPVKENIILEKEDRSLGQVRMEIRSTRANSHLGHVFEDGPEELGGLRYCINSAALRFVPRNDMEKEGYGDYLKYFDV